MCGIVGFYLWEGQASDYKACLDAATDALSKRGPDSRGSVLFRQVGLGHTRLSIIDISEAGSQPMTDASGRYVIVFNGEIYNYLSLREQLSSQGVLFHSRTDTEVLLNLYILYREKCLELINGFFAFAVYDTLEGSLFIARDRLGIKPLLFYQDDQKIIFSSEMKALLAFPIRKELDITSLYFYLQLNYIPAPSSVFKHVKKLEPGTYMTISANGHMAIRRYYRIAYDPAAIKRNRPHDYEASKKTLRDLLTDSVQLRLVADVPLGAFLSGGIDSSIIAGLAARMTDKLNTFSIGFKDEPYFDETRYANLMAEKLKTQHTVFSLTTDDLYAHLTEMLDYVDEPFADSSALAVYILSKHTRRQVTVALSGDGADELFAGYNKHLADYRARQRAIRNALIRLAHPVLLLLPASRNNAVTNLFRQAQRYAEGLALHR
ncbi:MAG: hypothetical protein KatS3mg031_1241 [Chitinophagales bacterium]|nr:MAG: hypothetical protein KatS3mg031_1241 [Chitinophagales bacterium]